MKWQINGYYYNEDGNLVVIDKKMDNAELIALLGKIRYYRHEIKQYPIYENSYITTIGDNYILNAVY